MIVNNCHGIAQFALKWAILPILACVVLVHGKGENPSCSILCQSNPIQLQGNYLERPVVQLTTAATDRARTVALLRRFAVSASVTANDDVANVNDHGAHGALATMQAMLRLASESAQSLG